MVNKSTKIKFENIIINIKYKKVKYIRLKVANDGEVGLCVPLLTSADEIIHFLDKSKKWLQNALKKYKNKDGKIYFLGNDYELKFNEKINSTIIIKDQIITPNLDSFEQFLIQKAKEKIQKYIQIYAPEIKKNINKVSIKKMKTRWGSCNSKKGYINLNLNLITKNEKFIEYVVLHELTHLIYPHHQKSFYDFIENLMPDFRLREKM